VTKDIQNEFSLFEEVIDKQFCDTTKEAIVYIPLILIKIRIA
jgi:hypothetical protein